MILNLVLAVAGLLLLSAFFSLFETAFFSLSRARLKQITATQPPARVEALGRLLARPQEILTLVVLAATLLHITLAVVGTVLLHAVIGGRLDQIFGASRGESAFLVVESLFVTFLLLVFGELAPKLYALAHAEQLALTLSGPMTLVADVLGPFSNAINRVLRLDRVLESHTHRGELITVEELKTIVEAGSREGTLDPEERELLRGAIRIGEVKAGEIMVRREDMVCVPADADVEEVLQIVRESWHSRIPVYQGTLDRVIGVIHAKDLVPYLEGAGIAHPVRELMDEPAYVPANLPIDDVLRLLQKRRTQIAVVTSPEGAALGVVTLEDVLEQLVGEMSQEYQGDVPAVETLEGGDALIQALVHVRDVNRILSLQLPTDLGRTMGDLARNLTPGPPQEGESLRVGGVELILESVVGGQIRVLRVLREGQP
jgi:CBS domain containing-hemolysin-like protein